MLRMAVQALLCVGVLPFYPFVLLFTAMMFTPGFWRDAATFTWENWIFYLIYPAAAIGLPALLLSIFVAPAALPPRWARFVVIGLLAGSFTAVTFLALVVPRSIAAQDWSGLWSSAWQLGGPLLVALWNLGRLWRTTRRPVPAAA